jgi:PadR family transcriptional regulator PadR
MKKIQLGEFEEVVLLTVGVLHGKAYGVPSKMRSNNVLTVRYTIGALQITLRRLESKGFPEIKTRRIKREPAWAAQTIFEITAYGKKALDYTKESRDELWNALPKLVLKLK